MSYYAKKQMIARIDEKGNIIGEIERWEAHRAGVLHRAFTVALLYQGKYILQHRKHPAFDGVFDLTSSSHQLMENGNLQSSLEAIYTTLEREWGLNPTDFVGVPKLDKEVYYRAKDPHSEFTEHELCEMWEVELKHMPTPNLDFAYGYSVVSKEELKRPTIWENLAPWVKKSA